MQLDQQMLQDVVVPETRYKTHTPGIELRYSGQSSLFGQQHPPAAGVTLGVSAWVGVCAGVWEEEALGFMREVVKGTTEARLGLVAAAGVLAGVRPLLATGVPFC